jgi:hypothetical protein
MVANEEMGTIRVHVSFPRLSSFGQESSTFIKEFKALSFDLT